MLSPPASPPASPSALEAAALPHAIRCWEAEVENARRLSARVQVLLSLATAVLGILFLRGWDATQVPAPAARLLLAGLLASTGLLVFAALVTLLRPGPRSRARPFASHWLAWPDDPGMTPALLDPELARVVVWQRTVRAVASLQKSNAAKQECVDRGQLLILAGTGCALGSFLVYFFVR